MGNYTIHIGNYTIQIRKIKYCNVWHAIPGQAESRIHTRPSWPLSPPPFRDSGWTTYARLGSVPPPSWTCGNRTSFWLYPSPMPCLPSWIGTVLQSPVCRFSRNSKKLTRCKFIWHHIISQNFIKFTLRLFVLLPLFLSCDINSY